MIRIIAFLVLVAAGALFFLVNYSTDRFRTHCISESEPFPSLHVVFETYRPWVFWGSSSGNVWVEDASGRVYFYYDIHASDQLIFVNSDGRQIGRYSRISESFLIELDGVAFSGACVRLP